MAEQKGKKQDIRFGYGSSYRKGRKQDLSGKSEIGAVFGGQVWMFKPDREAEVVTISMIAAPANMIWG